MPDSLSVVIPTRDTRDLTLLAVASVRREAAGAEVVVVDDAGVDDTAAAIANQHPDVVVLRQPVSLGYAAAVNRGLARCRGEILLLLNSDAEIQPGGLAALTTAFAGAPRLGVAGARLSYPDGRPQWSGGREPNLRWLFALASGWGALTAPWRRAARRRGGRAELPDLEPVDWVSGAAMALRRDLFAALGPLDEGYSFYAQDLDYCRRAAAAGWQVAIVNRFSVRHRLGATIGEGDHQRLDLLYSDLVRWTQLRRGTAAARRARRILTWGNRLRR